MNALVFLAFAPVGPIDAPVPSLESERARAIVAIQLAKIRLANEVKPAPKVEPTTPGVVVQRPFTPDGTPIRVRSAAAPNIASSRFYRTGNTFTAVPIQSAGRPGPTRCVSYG